MDEPYNSINYNPRRCERLLSTFGRKVLDSLMETWTADAPDRTRNRNTFSSVHSRPDPPIPRWTQRKVLTSFSTGNDEQRSPYVQLPLPVKVIEKSHVIDAPFDFEAFEKHLPSVPSFTELVKTVEPTIAGPLTTDRSVDETHVSTYDMVKLINPVIEDGTSKNMTFYFYNRPDDDGKDMNPKETCKNKVLFTESVKWNEMFDTELLQNANTTNVLRMIQQNAKMDGNENQENKTNSDQKQIKPKECTQKDNNDKIKRKNPIKISEATPKKVKKIKETVEVKTNFRKQKYTKIVKHWLDDVDPSNPVEEDEISDIRSNSIKEVNKIVIQSIEKAKHKPCKKVVQAQLANKDGKMKFGKAMVNLDNIDKSNEKKTKAKFVAPINSQLPVKDVEYDVLIMDNTNICEHIDSLRRTENQDLVLVLVYSNGFSQLNKQHSEDICDPEGFIVNIENCFYYFKGDYQSFKDIVSSLLNNNKVICYEGKSLLMYLKNKFELEFTTINMVDVKIGGSLLEPENPPETFSELQKLLSYVVQYTIATECVLQKAAWYATQLKGCGAKLIHLLEENELWSVFVDIEMKLVPIIAEMERSGVTVDLVKLKSMEDILLAKMREVERECYRAAGKSFQINSAVQVRAILYDELQLDAKSNVQVKETVQGAKSTSETMLRRLGGAHALPRLILQYRQLHRARATSLAGLAQHATDGVVRPTWEQTATATGRIASNNPNLQAIPKAIDFILFPDDANSCVGDGSLSPRSALVARAGHALLAADFRHLECRVLAHCAHDAALLAALQPGTDLFRALAAKWLDKPEGAVCAQDRDRTKRIVYAIMYGAGRRKLMDILGVSYEQTLSIMASFDRTFPSLKSFGRSVVARCAAEGGRLRTLGGRARRFRHIASADPARRAQAERQAINYVVQASAADLCKTAMVVAAARLGARARPLLQLHDELVWEVRDELVPAAADAVREAMEGCGRRCGMAVRLPVALAVGKAWGDMQPYPPPSPPPPPPLQ